MIDVPDPAVAPAAFTIDIAGRRVRIVCDDTALLRQVEQYYHAFADVSGSPAHLVTSFVLGSDEPPPVVALHQIAFDHRTGTLVAPYTRGTIDVEAGHAALVLDARAPQVGIEYSLRVIYALLIFHTGGLLLHSAAIVRQDQAFVFFGPSGVGKTTVSRLSPNDIVLNDDLVVVFPQQNQWFVCATPFWNITQVRPSGPRCAPLRGMLRLVQAPHVALKEMSRARALAELLSAVLMAPCDAERSHEVFAVVERLLQDVLLYELFFLADDSFWNVVTPLLQEHHS